MILVLFIITNLAGQPLPHALLRSARRHTG